MRKTMEDLEPRCCALTAKEDPKTRARDMGTWDTDAIPIVVDTATTRTITPRKQDLLDVEPYKAGLQGIGSSQITHRGRVSWKVRDDDGNEVRLEDDWAYYSPSCPYRLLCPASWKETRDKRRFQSGETEGDRANLKLCDETYSYVLTWEISHLIKLVGTRMVDNQSTPADRPHILHSRVD